MAEDEALLAGRLDKIVTAIEGLATAITAIHIPAPPGLYVPSPPDYTTYLSSISNALQNLASQQIMQPIDVKDRTRLEVLEAENKILRQMFGQEPVK